MKISFGNGLNNPLYQNIRQELPGAKMPAKNGKSYGSDLRYSGGGGSRQSSALTDNVHSAALSELVCMNTKAPACWLCFSGTHDAKRS